MEYLGTYRKQFVTWDEDRPNHHHILYLYSTYLSFLHLPVGILGIDKLYLLGNLVQYWPKIYALQQRGFEFPFSKSDHSYNLISQNLKYIPT